MKSGLFAREGRSLSGRSIAAAGAALTSRQTATRAGEWRKPDVAAHHVYQALQSRAFLLMIDRFRRYAVCHGYAVRDHTRADRVRALRVGTHAPQANDVRGRFHAVDSLWIHAPIRMIRLIYNLRVIGSCAEAHRPLGRDKEQAQRVYISHPIVDVLDQLQVARLTGWRLSCR